MDVYPPLHLTRTVSYAPGGTMRPITVNPPRHLATRVGRDVGAPWGVGPGAVIRRQPPAMPAAGHWSIQVVDKNGQPFGTFMDKATCEELTWELNGQGSGRISAPVLDPALHQLFDGAGNLIDDREVQVYRGSDLVGWFVPTSPTADKTKGTIQGAGPAYHLSRRFVGRLGGGLRNILPNGSFDTDFDGWTEVNCKATWERSPSVNDPGSVVLAADNLADRRSWLTRSISIGGNSFDQFVWLGGWCQVLGPIPQNRQPPSRIGLAAYIQTGSSFWLQYVQPDWTRSGGWQHLTTKLFVPAGDSRTMEVRLYCPQGAIRWDDIEVDIEEALEVAGNAGGAIQGLVTHAQSSIVGKRSANLTVDTSDGGGTEFFRRVYKYAEHANIMQAMGEFAGQEGGCDWTVHCTSHGRVIRTTPHKGFTPTGEVVLTWGDNIADFAWGWDASKHAETVAVIGRGSGFDYYEDMYQDPAGASGYEYIRSATIEGSLRPIGEATGIGRSMKRAVVTRVTTHRSQTEDLVQALIDGRFMPGRTVRIRIRHGFIVVDESFKIVRLTLQPEKQTFDVDVVRTDSVSA